MPVHCINWPRRLFRASMRLCHRISPPPSPTSSKWCSRGTQPRGQPSTSFWRYLCSSAASRGSSPGQSLWTSSPTPCSTTRTSSMSLSASRHRKRPKRRRSKRNRRSRLGKRLRQLNKWPIWMSINHHRSSCSSTTIRPSWTSSYRSTKSTWRRMS